MRGPNEKRTRLARALRQVDNDAETVMWGALRGQRLNGFKFVRQFPIGPYFADFACREKGLVVEIDGSQHAGSSHDETRDAYLNALGWSVARFWNADFLRNQDEVLATIVEILEGRMTTHVHATDFTFKPAGEKS